MKIKDYVIIASLLVIFGIALIIVNLQHGEPGSIGKVFRGSELLIEVDFNKNEVKIYPQSGFPGYPKVTDPIENEGGDLAYIIMGAYEDENGPTEVWIEIDFDTKSLRIAHDSTPKQIGVNRNWYNGTGLPVISLPNKVYIRFENVSDDMDGYV